MVRLESGTFSTMPWRAMTADDLAAVCAIADRVHVEYPEDSAVFAERLALYPQGCFVLELGELAGYVISHPWHFNVPPALNVSLGGIPQGASTYYLHDIALLPAGRGTGAASAIVSRLIDHAKAAGLANLSLVAVNASQSFWRKHGFRITNDPALASKLASYGAQARYMVRDPI